MPPCVTTAMSVGNLSEVRENGASSATAPGNRVSSAVSAGNVARIHHVRVTGAVSTGNIGKMFRPEKEKELGRAPSMANCLSTTVPVNLAASQIAGRHTPTRNSLRHSRMIVMNRTGNIPRKSQPPLLRHRKLARCLAVMQTVLGIAVTSLSLWLLLWSPNLPLTDNPYWSGMPLLLSGSFGVCLLCCFKKEYPGMSPGFCLSATKVVSVFLSTLASAACIIACVASAMHLARLTGLECTPPRVLNATCVCRPRGDFSNPSQSLLRYEDLNCPDVENILTILLIFSSTCNGLGAIVAGWYCYLHWSTREKRPKYMQVRTNPNSGNSILSRPIYNPNLNGR
ncbi:sarcospan isoform X2 [Cephus cinctus]|nr:sarcospan isoform X2 [Cephus cinctus]